MNLFCASHRGEANGNTPFSDGPGHQGARKSHFGSTPFQKKRTRERKEKAARWTKNFGRCHSKRRAVERGVVKKHYNNNSNNKKKTQMDEDIQNKNGDE